MKLESNLQAASIPLSIMNYNISSYHGEKSLQEIKKVQQYIDKFDSKFKHISLYLYGANSTQKTTIAHYIGRELCKKHVLVQYILMNDLIIHLTKENFFNEENDSSVDLIDSCRNVQCLIIDEAFDKEKILWYKSNYQLSFIDTFLRRRMEQDNKSVIFISNQHPTSIENSFNKSISDLIIRNTKGGALLTFMDDTRYLDVESIFD